MSAKADHRTKRNGYRPKASAYSSLERSKTMMLCSQRLQAKLDFDEVAEALSGEVCRLLPGTTCLVLWKEADKFQIKGVSTTSSQSNAAIAELIGASRTEWKVFRELTRMALASATPVHFSLADAKPPASERAKLKQLIELVGSEGFIAAMRTPKGVGALVVIESPCANERQTDALGRGKNSNAKSFRETNGAQLTQADSSILVELAGIGSLALANAEALALSRHHVDELQQLLNICSELSSSDNLDHALETFAIRAASFLGFERSFIALIEDGKCEVRHAAENGVGREMRIPLDTGVTRDITDTKEPFVTENAANHPNTNCEIVKEFKIRQYLAVPIIATGEQVLGIIGLLDRIGGKRIGEEEVRRAQTLATEVGMALQSAKLRYIAEDHRKRAEDLMGMALGISSSLSLPELTRNFTSRAAQMLGAKAVVLALSHSVGDEGKLETIVFQEPRVSITRPLLREMSKWLSVRAAILQEAVYAGDASLSLDDSLKHLLPWKNVTIARITGIGGELLGILCLGDCDHPLSSDKQQMLQALIAHGSIALENSRLFSRIAQSNKQWAEIFDSLNDFIVVHDDQHRIMRVNQPLAEFVGVRPAELIGIHMRSLLTKGERVGLQPCPFCMPDSDESEFVHPVLDRTYLLSTSRIHAADEAMQTIHVLKDVTERREAERRYSELFDTVQEGVFFSSPAGRFLEVNDALVRMLGYASREELLAIDISTQLYVTPNRRVEGQGLIRASGEVRHYEETFRRKDGTLINTLVNAFVVRDSSGAAVQYRGIILDVTERKRIQSQLQRERDFNTQILNNTQSMILVADTAGLVSYANRRCYEAGQYKPDALVGNRMGELVALADRPAWNSAFDAVLRGDAVDNLELQVVRGNGQVGKFSVSLSPMRGDQNVVNSVVVVMTDVTDLANIQAKLMHTEKLAAVGQLVSGVAHEVNNPLTAIMGFSDLLLENPELPESVHSDLRLIMNEAQRTKDIVQNLLSFARQMPRQRMAVDVNAILLRTIALRSYDLSRHEVELVEDLHSELPETVGDAHQLQQVFLNILNNAYDAVRETAHLRRGSIQIRTLQSDQDKAVEVHFADNGPGIGNLDRIFDPFFTTKEVGKGTGLGLSICYGILKQHGGEISAQNNVNGGATFVVKLPVASAAQPIAATAASAGGDVR